MEKADFALQWLDFLGVEVYNKGRRILEFSGNSPYEIKQLTSKIKLGEKLGEDNEEKLLTMPYTQLLAIGYTVCIGTDPDLCWRPGQKLYHKIRRKTQLVSGITYDSFRKAGLNIQHNPIRRWVRLTGPSALSDTRLPSHSGIGKKIVYDEDRPIIASPQRKRVKMTREDMRARMRGTVSTEGEYQKLKGIPILMTDDKYIVCIQKQRNPQKFLITGQTGKGKSVLTNALAGRIFYTWEDRVGWLIDPTSSFDDVSLPQDHKPFNDMNKLIGNEPLPVPAVHLYLACSNKLNIKHPETSLVLTQNWTSFLKDYERFAEGIKSWDLAGKLRYLTDYIGAMKDAKTGKDVYDAIEKVHGGFDKTNRGMESMARKWKSTFSTVLKEKFTSNLYGKDDVEWTDELEIRYPDGRVEKGHPWLMLLMAGVQPRLDVSAVRGTPWFRNYLALLMEQVEKYQLSKPEDERKRVWSVVDEQSEIYEHGKKKDLCSQVFEEKFRRGRHFGEGYIGNTQSLEKLNPEMLKNATHICCVKTQDDNERRLIKKRFGLDNDTVGMIGKLKELEVMIFSDEPFLTYDRWGRERVSDRTWFKGRIFPPINHHKARKKG